MALKINLIVVYLRDSIILIAELIITPEIMFEYKNEVRVRIRPVVVEKTPTHANLISSICDRRKYTQNTILLKSPMANLLRKIFNFDGVQLSSSIII